MAKKVALVLMVVCCAESSLGQSTLSSPTSDLLPTDLQYNENLDCPKIKDARWLQEAIKQGTIKSGSNTIVSLVLEGYGIGHWNALYQWSVAKEDIQKVPTSGPVTMLGWNDSGESDTPTGRTVLLQCYYKGMQEEPFRLNGQYAYSPYLLTPDFMDGQDYSKAPR